MIGSFHLLQFCWQCEDVDRDMDFIMAVVRTIRSLRSDYKLTKTAADCKQAETSTVLHVPEIWLRFRKTPTCSSFLIK